MSAPLQSLDDFNASMAARRERAKLRHPNGIACPQCGAVCVESVHGPVVKGTPNKWPIFCSVCTWSGHREMDSDAR